MREAKKAGEKEEKKNKDHRVKYPYTLFFQSLVLNYEGQIIRVSVCRWEMKRA